jgi:hypothetical protein
MKRAPPPNTMGIVRKRRGLVLGFGGEEICGLRVGVLDEVSVYGL